MAPEQFNERFKFNRGELEEFFEHPVWNEIARMTFKDAERLRKELENANPSCPDGVANILRTQGHLAAAKRFYGLRAEFVLHCVAKDDSQRMETTRRLELWKRLNTAPRPE